MKRTILEERSVSKEALVAMSEFHSDVVREVAASVTQNKVVVVGMAQNVFVRRVKKILREAKVDFKYLEYGSYASQWKKRLAIKLWSGWPTFPQVFVNGVLVGGYDDTKRRLENNTLFGGPVAGSS